MLLCDYAEALNGKLYIIGGGWDRVFTVQPISCSVAVVLSVPWHATNERHVLRVHLQSEDGVVVGDHEGNPVQMEGEFETGRPPGVKPGSDLRHAFTLRMQGLDLAPGAYSFVLDVDGTELVRAPFTIERPQVAGMPGLP